MIRLATGQDLDTILAIYERARRFMEESGNPNQWGKIHPLKELTYEDIEKEQLYVCVHEGKVHGVFAFIIGEDPTYKVIENGSWMSEETYGTIHRLASDGFITGVFDECIAFCKGKCAHLRIDTHFDNAVMQHLAEKNGFEKRGIIYVRDHSPRIAYEL